MNKIKLTQVKGKQKSTGDSSAMNIQNNEVEDATISAQVTAPVAVAGTVNDL